jgi:plasmid stability protein
MSSKKVASRGSEQFMVRFPDGMRERIKMAADENGRSMNAEIIHRLEQTFSVDDAIITNDLADTPKELAVQLVEELVKSPRFGSIIRNWGRIGDKNSGDR